MEVLIKEGVRREVAERAVRAASVKKRLQIIEDGERGIAFRIEAQGVWKSFIFNGSKGAFCKGVVVTVAFGAHALKQARVFKLLADLRGGVLGAAIGVENGAILNESCR